METGLEQILTRTYKHDMMAFMDVHPEAIEEAIALAVSNKQPFAWRAAWLLRSCMQKNDLRMQGQIKNILDLLPLTHDGHQRELLNILMRMEIPDEYEGLLFDACVNIWEGIEKSPSVRVTAFRVIAGMASKHPDLANEIHVLTQEHYLGSLSPGIRKSVVKMIKENPKKTGSSQLYPLAP